MIFSRAGKIVLGWLHGVAVLGISLFNAPPRAAMTTVQKFGRSLLVTVSLVILCIVGAMLAALGVYVAERGREMLASTPKFVTGASIIFVGVVVNVICVLVLLEIKKADGKLLAPPNPAENS
jgi:hypothetical protein